MPANVESMFYVREAPWHGIGIRVEESLNSTEALQKAGLDWSVIQKPILTDNRVIEGYKANVRDIDNTVLGVVTDRYRIVQNNDAFAFTDNLLGEGVKYETAGSLQGGSKVWLLARLPESYIISGDRITPYMVFSNAHDGTGSIKVAMTPIRVVCQNTLNLALSSAERFWSSIHTGDISMKLQGAKETLLYAHEYMDNLGIEIDKLNKIKISDAKVIDYINELIPEPYNATDIQKKNVLHLRENLKTRYFDAPDLAHVPKSAYRFVNAVSDFATHAEPLRKTSSYKENMFARTVEGNPLIDKAYNMVISAA